VRGWTRALWAKQSDDCRDRNQGEAHLVARYQPLIVLAPPRRLAGAGNSRRSQKQF